MNITRLTVWMLNAPEPFEIYGARARVLFKELYGDSGPIPRPAPMKGDKVR